MGKKHTPGQIKEILHEVDTRTRAGSSVAEACRALGVSAATYYLWRQRYGHCTLDQLEQLTCLQRQNASLEKKVARLSLDNAILKETLRVAVSLSPARRRELVRHIQETLGVSERRACAALAQPRGTQRYESQQSQKE